MFDFSSYIARITAENKLCAERGFQHTTCSGIASVEGVLERMRSARAIVCSSDVCQEGTVQRSGGYFRRRLFTAYILHRYDSRDRASAQVALQTCREVFRQFHSRFLHDEPELRGELNYLRTEDVRTHEFGADMFNGFAGLSFLIAIDEPADLQYRPNEWQE